MKLTIKYFTLFFSLFAVHAIFAQEIKDDFEGSGTIDNWFGDDCNIRVEVTNPQKKGINTSDKILEYKDLGGTYANVRFETQSNLDFSVNTRFSLNIYVPSQGLEGSQPNQISLKLQDGRLDKPWITQCEIIKPIQLDKWQLVSFDFKNDNYTNLNANSLPPIQRKDFNRVVVQFNGEGNSDKVTAYIDDFIFEKSTFIAPVFNQLVWSDEFDTDGPVNGSKWFHQTKLPGSGSWHNGEIQHYTDRIDNAFVQNGILKVQAKRERYTSQGQTKQFTSARLNSKFAFKYGKVECRAKIPPGVLGTWPAIWMLAKDINEDGAYWDNLGYGKVLWPACGEIDIMEHWGKNPNYIQSAMHTTSSYGGTVNKGGRFIGTATSDFHIYTLEWTAEKMKFMVDGIVHYIYQPAMKDADNWPFDKEFYMLLNFAIEPDIASDFTQDALELDYIRVYKQGNLPSNAVSGQKLRHYPNPVSNTMTIEWPAGTSKNIQVNIFDAYAKCVLQPAFQLSNNAIVIGNLKDLPQGIYLARVELDGKVQSFKFVKY
jgi:beta-glucanase (GH16 family)